MKKEADGGRTSATGTGKACGAKRAAPPSERGEGGPYASDAENCAGCGRHGKAKRGMRSHLNTEIDSGYTQTSPREARTAPMIGNTILRIMTATRGTIPTATHVRIAETNA